MNKLKEMTALRKNNPWFWIGLVSIVIAASGINVETLVTWQLLVDAIVDVLRNPLQVSAVILAIVGVFINPSTKGLGD